MEITAYDLVAVSRLAVVCFPEALVCVASTGKGIVHLTARQAIPLAAVC
ncbi:hypothetical protein GCM10025858_05580 [Alicyclobacillus sacchari]|nr:hypothetical protein [Alicyclobacillus sacchari]GMA56055.1 hypothetical protein GCM10025858_05580 [Alicyclobacillus sacchari]